MGYKLINNDGEDGGGEAIEGSATRHRGRGP